MPVIIQEFEVRQPVGSVWQLFQDVPNVVECMPGAELTTVVGPTEYRGRLSVKLGPISAAFEGEAVVEEIDVDRHRAVIRSKGIDKRGGSRGAATITYELSPVGVSTAVMIEADVSLQGRLAQFGRTGLLEEVSRSLTSDFARCLERKLGAATPQEAASARAGEVKGIRLFFLAVWRWIRRAFGRSSGQSEKRDT